jgi:hypothetical protein
MAYGYVADLIRLPQERLPAVRSSLAHLDAEWREAAAPQKAAMMALAKETGQRKHRAALAKGAPLNLDEALAIIREVRIEFDARSKAGPLLTLEDFDALAAALCDGPFRDEPLGWAVLGRPQQLVGNPAGDPPRWLEPDQVRRVAEGLAAFPTDLVQSRLNGGAFHRFSAALGLDSGDDYAGQEHLVVEELDALRDFYGRAATAGEAVVVRIHE